MAARYWVGGTASWDGTAGTKWALTSGGAGGQAVPTSADDVFFTNLSTGTCTIAAGNTGAKSITCTGFTGTIAGSAAISVSGSVTLATGMTVTYTGTFSIIATGTFTSAGKTMPSSITINGSGITFSLGDALSTTGRITLTLGTFTTNNFSVTANNGFLSQTGANVRTINLGSSTFTLNSDFLLVDTATNLTVNAGTSTIVFTSQGQFTGASKTYNNVSFTGDSVNNQVNNANTFNTLSITAPSAAGITTVAFDSNQTITTMVCAGASAVRRIMLRSSALGTARTLNATTWTTVSDVDFRDITLTNAKSPTRGGDCGGNTNITFPAAKTVYWNLAGTQSWAATGWATSSGGAPAVNNFPLAQDTAIFDNTGSVTGTISIFNVWNVGTLNMSTRTSAMTLSFSSDINIYGNWSTGSGLTFLGALYVIIFAGRSTQVVTSSGKTFPFNIFINSVGGTVQLADALTTSYSGADMRLRSGTLNLNGFTLTTSSTTTGFTSENSIAPFTRNITFNGGTLLIAGTGFTNTATNFTTTAGTGTGTISLTLATAKTFAGGGSTFNCALNQGGAGALTITGANTFNDITNTYAATGATSILFTAATTSTFINWNASGQAGRLLTIGSVTAASHTLSKASGTVSADYLSISNSTATGGATWYAGANSTNGGNNTGWIFTGPPSGNFLAFFM